MGKDDKKLTQSEKEPDLVQELRGWLLKGQYKAYLRAVPPEKIFKSVYDFSFLRLKSQEEGEFENEIRRNLGTFLKELGEDFSVLGRRVPVKINDETHSVDVVLYHRGVPCVVLVDLRAGKLDSRDVGLMNKCVNYYRRHKQYEHERDALGLIICQEAGREEVGYALEGLEEKIFIAEYKVKSAGEEKIQKI